MISPKEEKPPHPIDRHVGERTRQRRRALGLSQSMLGRRIGVSFQAVQKYEAGRMRISASRLYDVAQALAVPPGFFFDGYGAPAPVQRTVAPAEAGDEGIPDAAEVAALVSSFNAIRDPRLQAEVLRLVVVLSASAADRT